MPHGRAVTLVVLGLLTVSMVYALLQLHTTYRTLAMTLQSLTHEVRVLEAEVSKYRRALIDARTRLDVEARRCDTPC